MPSTMLASVWLMVTGDVGPLVCAPGSAAITRSLGGLGGEGASSPLTANCPVWVGADTVSTLHWDSDSCAACSWCRGSLQATGMAMRKWGGSCSSSSSRGCSSSAPPRPKMFESSSLGDCTV
uniref:Putative secreted protein n=1 Tax=Ixodes ricinus TaxID=34613 RepID=A0A6B0UPC4_IXORI